MAYYRRRNYGGYRGGYRQERKPRLAHKEWIPIVFNSQIDPGSSTGAQAYYLGFNDLKSDDATILRTRGVGSISFDSVDLDTRPAMTLGALVIPGKYKNERTTIPNPLVSSDTDDWFLWMPFAGMPMGGTGAKVVDFEIDSKAKRKMQADESVLFILGINVATAFGSDDRLDLAFNFRVLVGY